MPLKRCSSGGQSGWKFGDSGKCYTGPGAKQKAINQGLAIGGGKLEASFKALRERAEKFSKHGYVPQDDGGGDCKVCHMPKGGGNH